jgi:hypothetical protein
MATLCDARTIRIDDTDSRWSFDGPWGIISGDHPCAQCQVSSMWTTNCMYANGSAPRFNQIPVRGLSALLASLTAIQQLRSTVGPGTIFPRSVSDRLAWCERLDFADMWPCCCCFVRPHRSAPPRLASGPLDQLPFTQYAQARRSAVARTRSMRPFSSMVPRWPSSGRLPLAARIMNTTIPSIRTTSSRSRTM